MTKIIKTDSYTQDKALGLEESAAPTNVATTGFLYTMDDGGSTELYYKDAANREVQITALGSLDVPSVDVTKLVNSPVEAYLTTDPTLNALAVKNSVLQFSDTTAPPVVLAHVSANASGSLSFTDSVSSSRSALDSVCIGNGAKVSDSPSEGDVVIGYNAGYSTPAGHETSNNVFIGKNAGYSREETFSCIAIGNNSMYSATTATNCVIIGQGAGFKTNAAETIAIGAGAGYENTSGSNVLIGSGAGYYSTTGTGSTFIGFQAAQGVVGTPLTGNNNTSIGNQAGLLLRGAAADNTILGSLAGDAVTTGSGNVFVGSGSGTSLTADSNSNVIIGSSAAGTAASAVDRVVAVGFEAAKANTADGTVAIGYQAGLSNTSSDYNTFIGYQAGYTMSTGTSYDSVYGANTLVGYQAGYTSNVCNLTAIGYLSGYSVSSGRWNTFFGYKSGRTVSTGEENVYIGYKAGELSTGNENIGIGSVAFDGNGSSGSGCYNIAIGTWALADCNGASDNIAIGYLAAKCGGLTLSDRNIVIGNSAMYNASGSSDSVCIGHNSGYNSSGSYNVLIGSYSGDAASFSGTDNVAIGYNAMTTATGAANYNTVIGSAAGDAITSGTSNTLIGYGTGSAITTTSGTTAVGYNAGTAITSGIQNVAIGYEAGSTMTTSKNCVLIGYQAGKSLALADDGNVAIGTLAMGTSATCTYSIGIGYGALAVSTGTENIAIGDESGEALSTGNYNVLIGPYTGYTNLQTGSNNVAIGYEALKSCNSSDNTVIGYQAGDAVSSGTGNIFIGKGAGGTVSTGSNNIIVGPIQGSAADARTFKVGYHATNTALLGGVFHDAATGSAGSSDSALAINARTLTVLNPSTNIEAFRVQAGKLSTYGETAPDVEDGGLCLFVKPATSPNKNSLTFKLNNLTHGCTAFGETDTFAQYGRISDTTGSLSISGIGTDGTATNDGARGIYMYSVAAAADVVGTPSKIGSTSSRGVFEINTAKINGASVASWAGDDIIFAVRNNTATQFLVTGSGSIQGNSAFIEYDDEDDIKLVQSFSNRKANPYYARLNDLGVISKDGMCDMQKMDMLSIGAIGQLFNVIRGLAKRLGVSEDELYELAKQY